MDRFGDFMKWRKKFPLRPNWPLFRPAAGLNLEPISLDIDRYSAFKWISDYYGFDLTFPLPLR